MTEAEAVRKAIQLAGGQSALARKICVTPQTVQQWGAAGRIPPRRVIAVERAVDARVTRYELSPDIYGEDPAGDVDVGVFHLPSIGEKSRTHHA